MTIVYLGIGSNLGDRENNIRRALALLEKNEIQVLKCSSIIETEPIGGPPQRKFLNAALQVKTEMNPFELLKILKTIETSLGRAKSEPNSPRPVDIDILLCIYTHRIQFDRLDSGNLGDSFVG